MIWVLKHQGRTQGALHLATLWLDQATDHPKECALAAAVAAHQHPKSWGSDLEVATIERLGSARPAEADPIQAQCCLIGSALVELSHGPQASSEKPGRFVPPLAAVFS